MSVTLHPEVESKIKLKVVRSLGDVTSDINDVESLDGSSQPLNDKLNESLLDDGVSLKMEEENISEESETESEVENKSPEQNGI